MLKFRASAIGLLGAATGTYFGQKAYADSINAPSNAFSASKSPGVYLWGDNSQQLISATDPPFVRTPTRLPLFDNQKLRDLVLCNKFGVAALANGDVVQFDNSTKSLKNNVVLKKENVTKLLLASESNVALALTKKGCVYAWQFSEAPQKLAIKAKMHWFERIDDIAAGSNHCVVKTNHGRVFSGSLAPQNAHQTENHYGQFGIAQFSHFTQSPPRFELHAIKLMPDKVTQIACGKHHSLFLTELADLWGCGSNQFGQLLRPFSYKNAKNSVPMKLKSNIAAIAASSWADLTFFAQTDSSFKNLGWNVAGNGVFGQFGTGSFAQCQFEPLQLKALANMREFNETSGQVLPTSIYKWQIGATHVFAQVSGVQKEWLMWGSNERGQLGNNKLSKLVKPVPVTSEANFTGSSGYEFVAGDRISGCYVKV